MNKTNFLGHQCLCIEKDGKIQECLLNGIQVEKDEPIEECSALKEWHRWVEIRKKYPPPSAARDLTCRIVREQKELYEVGQKNIPLWEEISTEHVYCDPEIRFAPLERPTELPRSAQIRIPEVIIEEINPTVGTDSGDNELDPTTTLLEETPVTIPTSKLQSWTNNRYRIQVMKNYENQLKEYCPHFVTEADANKLVIIGKKMNEVKTPPPHRIPEIIVTECDDEIIPERELFLKSNQNPMIFTFVREINYKKLNVICVNKLEIANSTTVCIRWRFQIETETKLSSGRFVIGSPKGTILPGQTCHIPIWFNSKQAGYYIRNYIMQFQPKIIEPLKVNLIGIAIYRDSDATEKIEEVRDYIEKRVRERAIISTVVNLLHRIRPIIPPRPEYRSLFEEIELFENINPDFRYHLQHVIALKQVYKELTDDDEKKRSWNLSIETLRNKILQYPDFDKREEWFQRFSKACRGMLSRCLEVPDHNPGWFRKVTLCSLALGLVFERIEKQANRLRKWLITVTHRPTSKVSISQSDDHFSSLSSRIDDVDAKSDISSSKHMANENEANLSLIDNYLAANFDIYRHVCPIRQYEQMLYISTYKYISEAIDKITSILDTYQVFEIPKKK